MLPVAMTYTEWLRRQVARLENQIRRSSVFESETPASPSELADLRETVVLHTYMKQQLLRREKAGAIAVYASDPQQEFALVPVGTSHTGR
jgi:hypothetical protein